jgi:hypothetical protein
MPISPSLDREADGEALKRLLSELQRCAGWLAKDHASVAVRADVLALGAAMDTGNDTSLFVLALGKDILRLPSGGVRTMLRRSFGEMRAVLGPTDFDPEPGDRS